MNPNAGAQVRVEEDIAVEAQTQTYTTTEQMALYLSKDLEKIISLNSINLAKTLGIEDDQSSTNPVLLIQWLCSDLERLLSRNLISHVLFLLCVSNPDTSNSYKVEYKAQYEVRTTMTGIDNQLYDINGRIKLPQKAYQWDKFFLIVKWADHPDPYELGQTKRPTYLFDWTPPKANFKQEYLVRYNEGGLSSNSLEYIRRTEYKRQDNS